MPSKWPHHQQPRHEPTSEEIDAATAEIRAGWDEDEHRRRSSADISELTYDRIARVLTDRADPSA